MAGIDIDEMMEGAREGFKLYKQPFENNPSYLYAAYRNALYRKMRTTEIMVNYEPSLHYVTEWWKQLFGESEGKDGKGIFPAGVDFTTDLHSMGQYIQDGLRNIFETVLYIEKPRKEITVCEDKDNLDKLNYLSGKKLDFINRKAMEGTILAHHDGKVQFTNKDSSNDGVLLWSVSLFLKACGISDIY